MGLSGGDKPRGDKPEATAVESNFYNPIGADGERFDHAEELLAKIESNVAPLWDERHYSRTQFLDLK